MATAKKPNEQSETLNLIGKAVKGDSSKIIRTDIEDNHDVRFKMLGDAVSANVEIINAGTGQVVKTMTLGELKKGSTMK